MAKIKRSYEELYFEQIQYERDMFGDGVLRFTKDNDRAATKGVNSETHWNRRLTKVFTAPLTEAIQAYLDYYDKRRGKPTKRLRYLRMLPAQVSAYIALKVILDCLPLDRMNTYTNISIRIGEKIEDQVRFTRITDTAPKYLDAIYEGLKSNSSTYRHSRNVVIHAEKVLKDQQDARDMRENGATIQDLMNEFDKPVETIHKWLSIKTVNEVIRWKKWPINDTSGIGCLLLELVLKYLTMNEQPVIEKVTRLINNEDQPTKMKYKQNIIVPSPIMSEWVDKYKEAIGILSPCFGPCVIPPMSWTGPERGGFITPEVACRLPFVSCKKSHLKRLTPKQMPLEYRAINILQRVPWTINEKVLDVLHHILAFDMALVLPSKTSLLDNIDSAPIPDSLTNVFGQELKDSLTDEEYKDFINWKKDTNLIHKADRSRQSKFLKANRTVLTAEKYRTYERIYFVYSNDYRGRKYARSPSLSTQGDDVEKGLLMFANGVPLGKDGLWWLAMQGADKWDNYHNGSELKTSKMTHEERWQVIQDMGEDIRDIASNPLVFRMWVNADKPVQFLAWCFEWSNALDWLDAGKNPEEFISHRDPSNDGRCSGIQHYSAILKDMTGAILTDLVPSDRPHDIYNAVAKVADGRMTEIIDGDRQSNIKEVSPTTIKELCVEWQRIGVDRDITKKPVMTICYGSSRGTCRKSISDRLDKLTDKEYKNAIAENRTAVPQFRFTKGNDSNLPRYSAEQLATEVIWGSIGEVVIAAKTGMQFIRRVAGAVAKCSLGLEWVTPTGFIINQTFFKTDYKRVSTWLMGRIEMNIRYDLDEINLSKMKSSSAPNFIHGMDGCHCAMLICEAYDNGVRNIGVNHDEFRSSAGETTVLRKSINTAFVELYKDRDVLKEFKEYNEARILQEIDVPLPEYGDFDIDQVMDTEYAFD